MPIISDIPLDNEAERKEHISRLLNDPTKFIAIGNEFDCYDYVEAKKRVNVFVEENAPRVLSIIDDIVQPKV